ncbi:MAG: hypothetical protein ABI679_13760 [Gemmatimonadota bacterium]
MLRRVPLTTVLITSGVLAARVFRVPVLTDPLGSPLPPQLHLGFPALNLVFAPLFDLWDAVSMLSMRRLTGLVAGVLLFYLAWRVAAALSRRRRDPDAGPPIGVIREIGIALVSLVTFAAFVAGGLLWHRPMVSLQGAMSDMMVVDFHSHTNASHDVRGTLMNGYDAAANRRWHGRAGFDAVFITDHNTVQGIPHTEAAPRIPVLCPGIEVSAYRAHIVLLGNRDSVNRSAYSDSLGGVLQLLRESERKFGAITIASLPEYDRNHWANLPGFVDAGVDGFEIVNASPKANEFSQAHRDSVIALARSHNLLLVGVTDNHGWGATSMSWNLVRVPGWRAHLPTACGTLLARLKAGGTDAVQVIERHHLAADSRWPLILTPVAVIWETWRSLSFLQLMSWLIWVWLIGLLTERHRQAG